MEKKRVVVTGMGIITSLGKTIEDNWQKLVAGQSEVSRIIAFDPSGFRSQIAAEVKDFNPIQELEGLLPPKDIGKTDRLVQFGLHAAKQALFNSKIPLKEIDKSRIGVSAGIGFVGIITLERQIRRLMKEGPRHVSPFLIPAALPNLVAGQISIAFGIKGFNFAINSACAAGSHAIGNGLRAIQRGEVDAVVALGAEAPISPICLAGFGNMKALSCRNEDPKKASRPFDEKRDGFVMAEGAGALILEELEYALEREAKIYAEIVGFAQNSDASNIVNPTIEGPRDCMIAALKEAGLRPSDIDYINPHATSTPTGDINEAKAIKEVFGKDAPRVLVSSSKSVTGHLLGAAGAVEAIFSILALERSLVPPNVNFKQMESGYSFLNIPTKATVKDMRYVLSNSFGFGGTNACLVFKGAV